MKYQPIFLLLGFCFVLAGVIKVFEIYSIEFFKIKSTDFLVVFGAIFLACICWTISRSIPLLINYFNLQDKICRMAISNSYFGTEEERAEQVTEILEKALSENNLGVFKEESDVDES